MRFPKSLDLPLNKKDDAITEGLMQMLEQEL